MTATMPPARAPRALLNVTAVAYGVPFRLRVPRELLPFLRTHLPPSTKLIPGRGGAGGWTPRTEADVVRVVSAIELYIAQKAPGLIFVHAGAVAVNGRALLLPGRSRAGKSTLTAALVRAGATYLSDEFAALNPAGEVVPFARSIQIRATDEQPSYRWAAADMPSVATGPLPVRLIALTHFDAGDPWARLTSIGRSETMLGLIDNTVAAQARSDEMLAHCAAAVRGSVGRRGPRGEASQTVPGLLDALAAGSDR